MRRVLIILLPALLGQDAYLERGPLGNGPAPRLGAVRRVYVDRLTGDGGAAQMRDLLIGALQRSGRFAVTEDEKTADHFLRGAAEDLIFTDQFDSSESLNARVFSSRGNSRARSALSGAAEAGVGQNESTHIRERKHEAMASVRLVTKGGDVIWSTTQESQGAKFRSASADVAEKVVKQLLTDLQKAGLK